MSKMVPHVIPPFDSAMLEGLIKDQPYILFAPHSKERNSEMAYFLQPEHKAFYYAATSEDSDLTIYAEHLLQETQALGAVAKSGRGAATDAMQMLANAMTQMKARFVVLDGIDLIDPATFKEFVVRLRAALPPTIAIVLNGRQLDYRQWQPMISTGQAFLIGAQNAPQGSPSAGTCCTNVEVYGFGGGTVYANGLPVTVWDGPLPRNLFFYFVDHPMVTREEVFSTFWPDLPAKEATNVFHVTKRKVAERVGYETMNYASGFYHATKDVSMYYDVAQFEAAIEEGRRTPENLDAWQRAIKLYRQPFLHRLTMNWIVQRRQQLALSYIEALNEMARSLRKENPQQAIGYYLRVLRELPHREDVHREMMKLYAAQGQTDKLQAQYQSLESELKRAFNITPGKATRDLYASFTTTTAATASTTGKRRS